VERLRPASAFLESPPSKVLPNHVITNSADSSHTVVATVAFLPPMGIRRQGWTRPIKRPTTWLNTFRRAPVRNRAPALPQVTSSFQLSTAPGSLRSKLLTWNSSGLAALFILSRRLGGASFVCGRAYVSESDPIRRTPCVRPAVSNLFLTMST
jgi:hypothetical protein